MDLMLYEIMLLGFNPNLTQMEIMLSHRND